MVNHDTKGPMNLDNLRNNYHKLLSYMDDAGYSQSYIRHIRSEIKWILAENERRLWNGYPDICNHYERETIFRNSYRRKRTDLGVIMEFDLNGKLPDGKDSALIKRAVYTKLAPEFKAFVDYFIQHELERGIQKSTVMSLKTGASNFLLFLQEAGVCRLSDIREETALAFFLSSDMKPLKCSNYRRTIASFLKTCLPLDKEGCQKALSFIPMLRQARKNIQYLTPDEHRKILDALSDMSNTLTLRERAIGQIAVNYGMRSGDIAALNRNSIDFDAETIRIVQRKTQQPLDLPLLTVVGNAIYDYVDQQGPFTNSSPLFRNLIAPFGRISSDVVGKVSERIMHAAKIRQGKGDRKGFHLSRHHLVTALMGKGIPQPVISAIVGHTDPRSLEAYSYADHVHIKECALSVERFPVSLEVFPDE